MSRRAAAAGFEHFLEPTMTEIRREFSVGRALEGTGLGPGGHVIDQVRQHADTVERRLVDPEFQRYRDRSLAQFRVLLDAVESDHPLEAFDDALLAHDSYLEALKPSVTSEQRAMVTEMILTRLYRLGNGLTWARSFPLPTRCERIATSSPSRPGSTRAKSSAARSLPPSRA